MSAAAVNQNGSSKVHPHSADEIQDAKARAAELDSRIQEIARTVTALLQAGLLNESQPLQDMVIKMNEEAAQLQEIIDASQNVLGDQQSTPQAPGGPQEEA